MNIEDVKQKLAFAEKRLKELKGSNNLFSNSFCRQILTQEYFFHLVGSIETLAHVINETCKLGIKYDEVKIHKVIK